MRTEFDVPTFLLEMEKKFNEIQLFYPIGNRSLDIPVLREGTPK